MGNPRSRGLAGVATALVLVLSACGDSGDTTTTTTETETTTTTTTEATPVSLLVWTDENRASVVEAIAPEFTAQTGVEIEVEIVDFGQIKDQVGIAGPAGEGPDLFVGAHDWTGELAANGLISPLDLGDKADDFFDVAIEAFSFEGNLYAVPAATEAVAMFYNTDLAPEAPATFEEVIALCEDLDDIDNCVGLPGGGDAADAYHNYPFVSAMGGYIFAYDPASGYDTTDVGLDSEGAIAGVAFLEEQSEAGIIGSVNYDTAKNMFLSGREPFWITGPWEVGALNDQTDVNWGVAKLPTIDGNTPAPMVGAQGFFLSAFSENAVVARSFLLDFVATTETQKALFDADPRNPATHSVTALLADDPVTQTFALSAADGNPMPNIPEMGSVWGPLGDNILLVRNGESTAEEAMTAAAAAVREAVGG